MNDKPQQHRFLFSGYILSLLVFALLLCTGGCLWSMHYAYTQSAPEPPTANDWACVIFIGSILLFLYAAVIIFSREFTSWYTATGEKITLHALFRRPLSLRYEDVKYIGIGKSYGETRERRNARFIYTPGNDFWIYLSIDPVPLAQLNDMRKFKLSSRGFRIAYSRKVYDALCECLPAHLARDLRRAETTLRTHKAQN